MLDFEEAAALAPIVRVNGACCPTHGPVRPESYCYPLTVESEALRFMAAKGSFCMERGCEEASMLLDCEVALEPLHQHLNLWTNPDQDEERFIGFEGGPRVICELRPYGPWKEMSREQRLVWLQRNRAYGVCLDDGTQVPAMTEDDMQRRADQDVLWLQGGYLRQFYETIGEPA